LRRALVGSGSISGCLTGGDVLIFQQFLAARNEEVLPLASELRKMTTAMMSAIKKNPSTFERQALDVEG
jgi:hypothetical protein